jgi:hypothetical protein
MMEMVSKKDLAMARDFLTGSMLFQPLLVSTTRADVLEAAMRARAEEPDFGVDYDYVQWWRKYLVQRDHPELLRPFFNEAERQKNAADYSVNLDKAELELLAKLETLVQSKKGDAQKVTALTIKIIKSFRSP